MSTINTTITHYIYYGAGQTYTSPLTITNLGAVITTVVGRAAVKGSGGGTLVSAGTIISSGAGGTGVQIGSGGSTVNNSGFIQGYVRGLYIQGAGYVTNSGQILSTGNGANAAAELTGGGSLSNSGTIFNSASTGDGVRIDSPGATVTNSGLIEGAAEAVGMQQAGIVFNTTTGIIRSTSNTGDAVFQGHGGGTLTNQGTIITNTTGGNGVLINGTGSTIDNSGLIQAYDYGVTLQAAGFITNTGTILSTGGNGRAAVGILGNSTLVNHGSIISSLFAQSGVQINGAGDTVTNSGFIQGYATGFEMSGAGVVVNSGTIKSLIKGFIGGQADVMMPGGGSFTNTQGGYINHGVFLNVFNDGVGADSTVVNAGTITGGLYLNSELGPATGTGTVFDSGTITGSPFAIYFGGTNALLVLQQGYALSGIVDAAGSYPHTLELMSNASAPVTVNFNPNEFRNFGTVGFAPGSGNAGTLALAAAADVPGTIVGFTAPHDVIDLQYISDTADNATATLNPVNDELTVTGDNGSQILQLDPSENYSGIMFEAIRDASGTGTDVFGVICFCRGTQILTVNGEVSVEALKMGDRVRLADGRTEPIVWIGEGSVLATRGQRTAATPVIVRKGALGDNVPNRDLHITKAHSLYIDNVLIPVEFLVNHRSILWDDRAGEVSIYHIEIETHDVLIANGTPAESYRDDGNRWLFQNGNSGWDKRPKPACAPVLTGGPVVDEIWRRLLDRSGPRAGLPLTDDPDLHLMVDGERLNPMQMADGVYAFRLPGMPEAVRILSRAAAPQELGLARDPRSLGVAVRRIVARQGNSVQVIEANDARLDSGFHSFEADNGFRWTSGDAAVPIGAFAGCSGPVTIELAIASTVRYVDEGIRRRVA
jgi:hypothetical protein